MLYCCGAHLIPFFLFSYSSCNTLLKKMFFIHLKAHSRSFFTAVFLARNSLVNSGIFKKIVISSAPFKSKVSTCFFCACWKRLYRTKLNIILINCIICTCIYWQFLSIWPFFVSLDWYWDISPRTFWSFWRSSIFFNKALEIHADMSWENSATCKKVFWHLKCSCCLLRPRSCRDGWLSGLS